jgi:hypothetical protein
MIVQGWAILAAMADRGGESGVRLTLTTDQADSGFVEYALTLIELTAGVHLDHVEPGPAATDLYYGNDTARPCRLRIPRVDNYSTGTIPEPPHGLPSGDIRSVFPFDLFSAIRFWLADEAHASAPLEHFDEHGRLLPEHSAQLALDTAEVPLVNAYLLHFRSWVSALFAIAPGPHHLPPGKRCVVVLTHDVDSPLDPGSSSHALGLALDNLHRRAKVGRSAAYAAGSVVYATASRLREPGARHSLFREVMDAEEQRGFGSTFFFAATSRFSSSGCRRDVGYDITRRPLPQIIAGVVARGHEVGLHIGYLAAPDPKDIAAERLRLEAVAATPVVSSRHHYYHLGRPFWATLAAHHQAGLEIDSSISFNYVPGYRLGIALPFRPWNPETRKEISTVQVPTMLMDSMVCPGRGQTVDRALERVERVLANLKRFEGVATIDWHEYTSYPGSQRLRAWGETYLGILDMLAHDPEVAVYTLPKAAALSTDRRTVTG